VAGALMPDAHVGYGLPIGGVLATENAVIPYAVGVDIACRMKMTVLDLPVRDLAQKLGITGTPVVFFENGKRLSGYEPAERFSQRLANNSKKG